MASICSCSGALANFGIQNCDPALGNPAKLVLIPREKDDGTLSGVDTASVGYGTQLPQATFDAAFNAQLQNDRWFIIDRIKGFEPISADDDVAEWKDGTKTKLRDGMRGVKMTIYVNNPYSWARKFNKVRCSNMTAMWISDNGSLLGEADGTYLRGRRISEGSISAKVIPQNSDDKIAPNIELTIDYDRQSGDEKVDYIDASDMDVDLLTTYNPLIDVDIEFATSTQTSATFEIFEEVGGMGRRLSVDGMTTAELEIYNETDSAAITPSGLTQDATTKVYTATYASQDVSDVIHVRGVSGNNVQGSLDFKLATATNATIV